MQTFSKLDQPDILTHLFKPQKTAGFPCPSYAEEIPLEVSPGLILTCRYYSVEKDSPTLLYYPKPGEPASSFDPLAKIYNEHGMNVFLASYRGQEKNSGSPTIEAMLKDGGGIFRLVSEWLSDNGFSGPLFVMGQSLGSVCAIDTVLHNAETVKGLIIESGISETASFLKAVGVHDKLADVQEEEGFNNIRKIEKIKVPTIIFHGARDGLVSVAQAENLQACSGARSKQFFVIPGAEHDSLAAVGGDLYFQTIKKYIDTTCGVNTWRRRRKGFKGGEKG